MSASVPYPVFTLAGLLPWTFFAGAVTNSGNSLIGNASVITKVYFPRLLIPAAAVAATLVDLTITCALLAGLMLYYGTGLHSTFLVIPFLIALLTLLALAIGTWIAAVNVRYRDARYALPFLMQVWLFASPVIYSVPRGWRSLLMLNPLTGIIEGFRSAVFGWPFDWPALASAAAITFVCLCYSAVSFGRMERDVADII